MDKTGLVSVSFRQNSCLEIAELCRKNSLSFIEWGGDIHCPAGDAKAAKEAAKLSETSGLCISSYGSYYRIGKNKDEGETFRSVLDSAENLGAPIIRIWAGDKSYSDMTKEEYKECIRDARLVCSMAEKSGKNVAFECHNWSLTDDYTSSQRTLSDIGCGNMKMYWQPNQFKTDEYNLEAIKALSEFITIVHVFNWKGDEKLPLKSGAKLWKKYVGELEKSPLPHKYLLEFMPNGKIDELPDEAEALFEILR